MVTDQYSADCEREQARRETLSDSQQQAWDEDFAVLEMLVNRWGKSQLFAGLKTLPDRCSASTAPPQLTCAQCTNWRSGRHLHLADGTTRWSDGFCCVRAGADLE